MLKKLTQHSTKTNHKNPYWEYRQDEYILANGSIGVYFYAHTRGSVFVIPINSNGNLIVTKQFRYLNQQECIEFPGGGIPDNWTELDAAKQELREEAGYSAMEWKKIGLFNPMNGVTNEICNVYVATELEFVGAHPEESEEFEIIEISQSEFSRMITNGEIWDGMTLAAWSLYCATQPQT